MMNDKMLELYKQAHLPSVSMDPSNNMLYNTTCFSPSKFAELIVRECAKIVEDSKWNLPRGHKAIDQANLVKEHFGITE
jgi:hypothetical protein